MSAGPCEEGAHRYTSVFTCVEAKRQSEVSFLRHQYLGFFLRQDLFLVWSVSPGEFAYLLSLPSGLKSWLLKSWLAFEGQMLVLMLAG